MLQIAVISMGIRIFTYQTRGSEAGKAKKIKTRSRPAWWRRVVFFCFWATRLPREKKNRKPPPGRAGHRFLFCSWESCVLPKKEKEQASPTRPARALFFFFCGKPGGHKKKKNSPPPPGRPGPCFFFFFFYLLFQPLGQPASRPTSQSVSQPVSQPGSQPVMMPRLTYFFIFLTSS